MPFCPKCKNEYREGFTVCPDCDCALVDCLKEDSVQEECEPEPAETDFEKTEMTGDSAENIKKKNSAVYYSSDQQAEDNKSSAWSLLTVGIAGVILIILVYFEVIPLHFGKKFSCLSFIVMLALFLGFIVAGIFSFKKFRILKKEAKQEMSLFDSMKEWCFSEIDPEKLDSELFDDEISLFTDEELYFKRTDALKEKLSENFKNADEGFLDDFLDQIYEELF